MGFTYFYTYATFNPAEVSNNIKKNGGFIPGIRAGKPTSDYLASILKYITTFGHIVSFILLTFIGGKMIYEGLKKDCDCEDCSVSFGALIVQGIATSIDALSVGLDIGEYNFYEAFVCCIVIALVTFIVCMFGVWTGKKFGNMLSNKATVLGGIILVCIGIYIFIKGILGI